MHKRIHALPFTVILITAITLLFFLLRSFPYPNIRSQIHYTPSYAKLDIQPILNKPVYTQHDYEIILKQTGLGKPSVDAIKKLPDAQKQFLSFQDAFFSPIQYKTEANSIISLEDSIVDDSGNRKSGTSLAPLKNGDILITKASHTFFYINGHAALVTDERKKETLESVVLGQPSTLQSAKKWTCYPNFLILRMKNKTEEIAQKIVSFALDKMQKLPYDLTIGTLKRKFQQRDKMNGTYCSHLVWRAYKELQIDLDSDEGRIVTPKDIANSPNLEIIQVYGMDPENPWP